MPKHEIIISADVEDVDEKLDSFISKVIRTALDAEGVKIPCEVNVLVANDAGIHQVNLDMRNVDAPTDVLSFPMFDLTPGDKPSPGDADPATGPRSMDTAHAGSWPIWPSTPCCICWATTTWTRGR